MIMMCIDISDNIIATLVVVMSVNSSDIELQSWMQCQALTLMSIRSINLFGDDGCRVGIDGLCQGQHLQ